MISRIISLGTLIIFIYIMKERDEFAKSNVRIIILTYASPSLMTSVVTTQMSFINEINQFSGR